MKITNLVEKSKKGFEPQVMLPAKIEDLLMPRPVIICHSFEALHPNTIDLETDSIHPVAHFCVELITQSNSFKEWMSNLIV
jgi:hypothetical protein